MKEIVEISYANCKGRIKELHPIQPLLIVVNSPRETHHLSRRVDCIVRKGSAVAQGETYARVSILDVWHNARVCQ